MKREMNMAFQRLADHFSDEPELRGKDRIMHINSLGKIVVLEDYIKKLMQPEKEAIKFSKALLFMKDKIQELIPHPTLVNEDVIYNVIGTYYFLKEKYSIALGYFNAISKLKKLDPKILEKRIICLVAQNQLTAAVNIYIETSSKKQWMNKASDCAFLQDLLNIAVFENPYSYYTLYLNSLPALELSQIGIFKYLVSVLFLEISYKKPALGQQLRQKAREIRNSVNTFSNILEFDLELEMSLLLDKQDEFSETSIEFYEEILQRNIKLLGVFHPHVIEITRIQALQSAKEGRADYALRLLKFNEKRYSISTANFVKTYLRVGYELFKQSLWSDAEKCYSDLISFVEIKKLTCIDKASLEDAYMKLKLLAEIQNKQDEAAILKEHLKGLQEKDTENSQMKLEEMILGLIDGPLDQNNDINLPYY